MPKLTREQYNKWNAKATNGFSFDIQDYVFRGEKTLTRRIPIDEDHYTELHLMYRDEYITKTNEHGCRWNVTTGRQIPTLHVSKWTRGLSGEVYTSSGMGDWITVGEPQTSKKYDVLCKIAETIDASKYERKVA